MQGLSTEQHPVLGYVQKKDFLSTLLQRMATLKLKQMFGLDSRQDILPGLAPEYTSRFQR